MGALLHNSPALSDSHMESMVLAVPHGYPHTSPLSDHELGRV